jgi:hypothetical protein
MSPNSESCEVLASQNRTLARNNFRLVRYLGVAATHSVMPYIKENMPIRAASDSDPLDALHCTAYNYAREWHLPAVQNSVHMKFLLRWG